MAGLKCAPDTRASVWISTKSTNTCTRPITDQSVNGFGFCGVDGPARKIDTAGVTKKTSAAVPMNSATYAAGPRSCTSDLLGAFENRGSLTRAGVAIGFAAVKRA